jgi:hypothetical protein
MISGDFSNLKGSRSFCETRDDSMRAALCRISFTGLNTSPAYSGFRRFNQCCGIVNETAGTVTFLLAEPEPKLIKKSEPEPQLIMVLEPELDIKLCI